MDINIIGTTDFCKNFRNNHYAMRKLIYYISNIDSKILIIRLDC